jgi:hypothetical protein
VIEVSEKTWGLKKTHGFKPGMYDRTILCAANTGGTLYMAGNKFILDTHHNRLMGKFPGGGDWSGYERLRFDAKCGAAAVIHMGVEDADIQPPVLRRFSIPAGKWVTVEVDLTRAVEARGMDLASMANFWLVLEEMEKPAALLLDNVRQMANMPFPASETLLKPRF